LLAGSYPTSGPEAGALEVRELPDPDPGPGEVRVRVAVSGVNPTDWKARRPGSSVAASQPELVIPNQDGAGKIDAVGEGVDPARVGERVWLYNAQWQRAHGTAAQWVALPAEQAVPLPDTASLDLGASLGIPAITAHRCLFADGALPEGTHVLVTGGAGAVGHAAIELAVWSGVAVAATVSNESKARLARAAGAELVVNYRTDDVAAAVREWAPDGVARVVDVDIGHNIEVDAQVMAPGGAIVSYATPREPVSLPRALMVLNASVECVLVYTIPDDAKRAATEAISAALEDEALTTLPLHRFPLAEVAAAHDAVRGGAVGKVLIDIP
jgi:NADPH2:quinone reductase